MPGPGGIEFHPLLEPSAQWIFHKILEHPGPQYKEKRKDCLGDALFGCYGSKGSTSTSQGSP